MKLKDDDVNMDELPPLLEVHSVCQTWQVHKSSRGRGRPSGRITPYWTWGEMRGGTPAHLIQTPYGPLYLTFFHSSSKIGSRSVRSYYMGAYLFLDVPPFGITHMSHEPIIPRTFYYDNMPPRRNGLTQAIVFPMNFFVRNNTIFLSLGYQDNRSWLIEIFLDKLLKTLLSVKSETGLNAAC